MRNLVVGGGCGCCVINSSAAQERFVECRLNSARQLSLKLTEYRRSDFQFILDLELDIFDADLAELEFDLAFGHVQTLQ